MVSKKLRELSRVTGAVRWIGAAGVLMVLCAVNPVGAGEMVASLSGVSAGSNGTTAASAGVAVIEIWKTARKLQLHQGDSLLGEFRVALGQQPRDGKQVRGDGRTPVGRYYVAEKNHDSRFHRFLGISYPNTEDAERGYQKGILDAAEWADIFIANLRGEEPPQHTVLGGRVGIHGYGGRPYVPVDWTEGCIAVSDEDIEYIFDRVSIGTPVIINE